MIDFIKPPYISQVEGVTNTETRWKITKGPTLDSEELEDSGFSADFVNSYFSNLVIPVGDIVYVWFQMKMSNDEIKDFIGPMEYISRDANITSDLKPSQYVDTPTISVDENTPIASGTNIITFNTSVFRGDSLDGHLASSWAIKAPDGTLIDFVTESEDYKYSFSTNKSKFGLAAYDYVEVYCQHHSSDGAVSEFGRAAFLMNVYPFKYVGETSINSTLDFRFSVSPYDPENPNLSRVDVVDVLTNTVYISFADTSTLNFTIPAYTLPFGKEIRIELYVDDTTLGDGFPVRLEVNVYTFRKYKTFTINSNVEYDYSRLIEETGLVTGPLFHGRDRMVSDRMVVVNNDATGFGVVRYNISNELYADSITADAEVLALLSSDYKLFNLQNGLLILVSRIGDTISLSKLVYDEATTNVSIEPESTLTYLLTNDVYHSLKTTATLSEDEKTVYLITLNNLDVELSSVGIVEWSHSKVPLRGDINLANYVPETMLLQSINDKSLVSFGGVLDSDMIYTLNIANNDWLPTGAIPTSMVSTSAEPEKWFVPTCIQLQNRGLMFTNASTDIASQYMYEFSKEGKMLELPAAAYFDNYTLFTIEANGVLAGVNKADGRRFRLDPRIPE